MRPVRDTFLRLARAGLVRGVVTGLPTTPAVVRGFVPATDSAEAVATARALVAEGHPVALAHLATPAADLDAAAAAVAEARDLLAGLAAARVADRCEIVVDLAGLGRDLEDPTGLDLDHGRRHALEHARAVCRAARNAGASVVLEEPEPGATDTTLAILRDLRKDFPETGVTLAAARLRTEADCRSLARSGARVRLVRGDVGREGAHPDPDEGDRAFVRCLKVLLGGAGRPTVATHDPRLIDVALTLAGRYARAADTYEFQLRYGVGTTARSTLAESGETVRVFVPYGEEWYPYVVRRLAAHPGHLSSFVSSFSTRK